jgi:hypothetical protein
MNGNKESYTLSPNINNSPTLITGANTNNVNKTWALLQTTGGKGEVNIVFQVGIF